MIEQRGLRQAEQQLARFRQEIARYPEIARGELAVAVTKILLLMQAGMAVYPKQVAGSRYRRTGTLGRAWTSAAPQIARASGSLLEGRVGNATPYGPKVQRAGDQMDIHRSHGWQTDDDVGRETAAEAQVLLGQAGGRIVSRLAGAIG